MTSSQFKDTPNDIELVRLCSSAEHPVSAGLVQEKVVQHEAHWDMHYSLELGLVLSGRMRRSFIDRQLELGPGELWFCGIWEPHGWQVLEAGEALVVTIWPALLAESWFPEAPNLHWMSPFNQTPKVPTRLQGDQLSYALDICNGFRQSNPETETGRLQQRFLLFQLLMLLPQVHTSMEPANQAAASTQIRPAIELAFSSRDLVSNEQAARACGMSRDHFIRRFSKLMGITFGKFALRHRLHRAANEIAGTDKPLKSIAADWGFTDASHLIRQFERHYHCSPAAYRARRYG